MDEFYHLKRAIDLIKSRGVKITPDLYWPLHFAYIPICYGDEFPVSEWESIDPSKDLHVLLDKNGGFYFLSQVGEHGCPGDFKNVLDAYISVNGIDTLISRITREGIYIKDGFTRSITDSIEKFRLLFFILPDNLKIDFATYSFICTACTVIRLTGTMEKIESNKKTNKMIDFCTYIIKNHLICMTETKIRKAGCFSGDRRKIIFEFVTRLVRIS